MPQPLPPGCLSPLQRPRHLTVPRAHCRGFSLSLDFSIPLNTPHGKKAAPGPSDTTPLCRLGTALRPPCPRPLPFSSPHRLLPSPQHRLRDGEVSCQHQSLLPKPVSHTATRRFCLKHVCAPKSKFLTASQSESTSLCSQTCQQH